MNPMHHYARHLTRRLSLLFATLLLPALLWGQGIKKSSGEFQLRMTNTGYSHEEACEACLDMARIDAITKQYGEGIMQGNAMYVENTYDGNEATTRDVIRIIAETEVNGEWVETLEEDCTPILVDEEIWINCKVKGKVRPRPADFVELDIKPLRCEHVDCRTETFSEGENLFLYIKSGEKGYISIFLSDEDETYRIFPYRKMPEGKENSVKIMADREYLLFSMAKDGLDLRNFVDEYELDAETEQDLKRLYVLYSPGPIGKPLLNDVEVTDVNKRDQGYLRPPELDTEEFQRWLAKLRKRNPALQVSRLDITVSKS